MRLRKPGSKPSGSPVSGVPERLSATAREVAVEVIAIAREMLRIPAGLYMRAAESAGAAVLAAWQFAWPILQAAWRLAVGVFRLAEREITPLRAALAVAAAAAIALAASQFADYRSVAIGTSEYAGVGAVAPAPEVDAETAGSAHAWIGLPLAVVALALLGACVQGRRLAWWLAPIGAITVAVSLIVDAPKGLDEGTVAIAYEGAKASLLGGFWVQLACGVLLLALAPLLASLLAAHDGSAAGAPRRRLPWGRLPAGEAGG